MSGDVMEETDARMRAVEDLAARYLEYVESSASKLSKEHQFADIVETVGKLVLPPGLHVDVYIRWAGIIER